jgi:hypothetical protein
MFHTGGLLFLEIVYNLKDRENPLLLHSLVNQKYLIDCSRESARVQIGSIGLMKPRQVGLAGQSRWIPCWCPKRDGR